jgi:formiminotetrahydrofolate cyclodeaminase
VTDFSKLSLEQFLAALASDAPTPGGGTAAAVAGAMGAALAEMVAQLTLSKEKYASAHESVRPIAEAGQLARAEFLSLARQDSEAYDQVVAARRMPKDTEAEKSARQRQIAVASRNATEVPMRTAQAAIRLLAALPELAEKGNPNAVSDVGAGALLLDACVEGALLNVGINLSGIEDATFVAEMQRETSVLQGESQRLRSQVVALVRKRF